MNLKKISISLLMLIVFVSLGFYACSSNDISGGSEIGNPKIVAGVYGRLIDEADNSLSNVKVSLLPVGHNPSKSNSSAIIDTIITDSNGFYVFENIDSANYNIEAFTYDRSLAIQINNILYSDSVLNVGVDAMHFSGSIQGGIEINIGKKSGVVCYIPGTTLHTITDDLGELIFPNVAEGNVTINYEFYRSPNDTEFITLIDSGVIILSGVETKTAVVEFQVPDIKSILFENGFEDGSEIDWSNTVGSTTPWRGTPVTATSSDSSREGDRSVHFISGDSASSHTKLQIRGNELSRLNWNNEYWLGFSVNVEKAPSDSLRPLICQHQSAPFLLPDSTHDWTVGAGPNTFAIVLTQFGKFEIRTTTRADLVNTIPSIGSSLWGTNLVEYSYEPNKWYDFVLHFRYATDSTGFITVWVNGEKIAEYLNQPTAYKYDLNGRLRDSYQYQSIGINYGLGNWNKSGEILYDSYRLGNKYSSYKEVAPRP